MKLANRVSYLKGSTVLEIAAKATEMKLQGLDVISLAAGEPDFDTPAPIQDAATKAMREGITRYAPSGGYLALRETIAKKVSMENGFQVAPDEVVVTCGAKHAIFMAMQCLLNPGDFVLIPTPAWLSYQPMIELAGGQVFPLPLAQEDGYRIRVDRWKGLAIPPTAKGIFINSPNNPTGVVYSKEELKALVGWAMQRNLWILSDEIYEKILFDGEKHVSIASLGPEVKQNTITISGFSKSYCMTGWRLGWAIADKPLISKMANYQSQSNSHVTSFIQMAGVAATALPDQVVSNMVVEFDKRRKYCMERLDRLSDHLSYVKPTGAFYFFMNLEPWLTRKKMSDVEFCKELLSKALLGAVPGSCFGQDNTVRFSYAISIDQLEKAFDRFEKFLKL